MSPTRDLVLHQDKTSPTLTSLELTLPSGVVETYALGEPPSDTSMLVQDAIAEIEENLPLSPLLDELDRAARLMFVAYNALVDTEIAPSVRHNYAKLRDLCGTASNAMTEFSARTATIIDYVSTAFECLLALDEDQAIHWLQGCAQPAEDMAKLSHALAGQFEDHMGAIQADANTTRQHYAGELALLDLLKKQDAELKANLAAKRVAHNEVLRAVKGLSDDIAETQAQLVREEMRAALLRFLKGFMRAIKAIFSAGLSELQRLAETDEAPDHDASHATPDQSDSGATADQGDPDAAEEVSPELVAASETVKRVQASVHEANDEVREAQTKVEKTTEAKEDALLKRDQATAEGDTNAETRAESEVEVASAENDEALGLRTKARARLSGAMKDLTDAQKAAAKIAESLHPGAAGFGDVAECSATSAQSTRARLASLIQAKREQERLDREALSSIARLTVQLESSHQRGDVAASSAASLQLAVWAFSNIGNALLNAERFWDNLARCLRDLARNDLVAELIDEVASGESAAERLDYYTSDMFMPAGVYYLTNWVALHAVSEEYVAASSRTFNTLNQQLEFEPSRDEAGEALPGLVAELKAEIAQARRESKARSEALASHAIAPTTSVDDQLDEV